MVDQTQKEITYSLGMKREDKLEDVLQITKTLTDPQVQHILDYAQSDPEVVRFTSDPNRFTTIEAFRLWQKNKALYGMVDKSSELLGIIWFEKMQLSNNESFLLPLDPTDYGITFAIRTYDKARGQKLARKFMGGGICRLN